ncbi:hypothetical protein BJX99DRAFT_148701 [Aspergillus californicus]
MQQPTSPSQWPANHPREQYNTHIPMPPFLSHAVNPSTPVATPGSQPAPTFLNHVYPCFSFDHDCTYDPTFWLDSSRAAPNQLRISNGSRSPACSCDRQDLPSLPGDNLNLATPLALPLQEPDLLPYSPPAGQAPSPSMQNLPNHNPVYQCKWLGCRSTTSFRREIDLMRHLKTVHVSPKAYPCTELNCPMGFGRKDHLKAHLKTHQQSHHRG